MLCPICNLSLLGEKEGESCSCNSPVRVFLKSKILELQKELEEKDQKISEIATNCPSCGRHDFGLLGPDIAAFTREKNRADKAEETVRKILEVLQGHGDLIKENCNKDKLIEELHKQSFIQECREEELRKKVAYVLANENMDKDYLDSGSSLDQMISDLIEVVQDSSRQRDRALLDAAGLRRILKEK